MSEVDHIVLTRFNLPSAGAESVIRAKEGWLRDRMQLFERYTVPSMSAQTVAPSAWFVYLDPESPDWLRERMADHARTGVLVPIYRESVSAADIAVDAELRGVRRSETVITTNLDNDDGLAHDFAERLQALPASAPRTALYLAVGLILSPKGAYLRRDPVNAFCSVREPWTGAMTCWVNWHNLLPEMMPVARADGAPAWLQVVHGTNVSNRVRGRLVRPDAFRLAFGHQLDDLSAPPPSVLIKDRLLNGPGREAREQARALIKKAIMGVGGKQALDALKNRRSAFSRS